MLCYCYYRWMKFGQGRLDSSRIASLAHARWRAHPRVGVELGLVRVGVQDVGLCLPFTILMELGVKLRFQGGNATE